MLIMDPTTRAYTLKLSGEKNWSVNLGATHAAANRGVWSWGSWLLTLRGGLPPTLATDQADRRVILALSWLSVESPASLAPAPHIVATGKEDATERSVKVMSRFRSILKRLKVVEAVQWENSCEASLCARIRDDAVWVDRSACFHEISDRLDESLDFKQVWDLLGRFFGSTDSYFRLPNIGDDKESSGKKEEVRELIKEAMGWLSNRFGVEEKGADFSALSDSYLKLSEALETGTAYSGISLIGKIAQEFEVKSNLVSVLKCIGASGHKSATRNDLKRLAGQESVSADELEGLRSLALADSEGCKQRIGRKGRARWASAILREVETECGLQYQLCPQSPPNRDEHSVLLDHAARKVKVAHAWIKRAEAERRRFQEEAAKTVSEVVRKILDQICDERFTSSNAVDDYIIRKGALDGWGRVVEAWDELPASASKEDRIQAARGVQRDLDDDEKWGDSQLFERLAHDDATCVWRDEAGAARPDILKTYSEATVAAYNQRRFKVPAYRHPDPLRNPVFVDFGNSRWDISFSALKAVQQRKALEVKLAKTKVETTRQKIREELENLPSMQEVTLGLWTGEAIEPTPLKWQAKRFCKDLAIDWAAFGVPGEAIVTRADRLGRAVANQPTGAVTIADVFSQKEWNGRLQAPRNQLDHLANLVYGKRGEPSYDAITALQQSKDGALTKAHKLWTRLSWFITTSAKLTPRGPWLDFVESLPTGIKYKKGRTGWYLDYEANKSRKGRARLQLPRIPDLRVLSLDLGHRYAAACAVLHTLTQAALKKEIAGRTIVAGSIAPDSLYLHTLHQDAAGKNRKTIYRRTAADMWARIDRQFLIRLQGEEAPARRATQGEFAEYNDLRSWLGLPAARPQHVSNGDGVLELLPRIDELHEEAVQLAKRGLRTLGDAARIAHAMTAQQKPLAGGKLSKPLTEIEKQAYIADALTFWHGMAADSTAGERGPSAFAAAQWTEWIEPKLTETTPELKDAGSPAERRKRQDALRLAFIPVAASLDTKTRAELNRLWANFWNTRNAEFQKRLRWLRGFVLPRKGQRPAANGPNYAARKQAAEAHRQLGGLSVARLRTIRSLYETLKAYHMRPEPDDLRKNIPLPGDESLANFGRRILDRLEQKRQQRVKQLASRIVEAALGVGSENAAHRDGHKRPASRIADVRFDPCHVVVVEDLEHYRPEETRFRRENRRLMDWQARNVRKYIIEGCQLHGLHFVETSPSYTSKQDSRTGAPGVRCEDTPLAVMKLAIAIHDASSDDQRYAMEAILTQKQVSAAGWLAKDLAVAQKEDVGNLKPRQKVLLEVAAAVKAGTFRKDAVNIRLPRTGGELFVSTSADREKPQALQADLNAAVNIGLRPLFDPDWDGAWWFVPAIASSGKPDPDKVGGSTVWSAEEPIVEVEAAKPGGRARRSKKSRSHVNAWNPLHAELPGLMKAPGVWPTTPAYWKAVEEEMAGILLTQQVPIETPW